MELVCSEIPKPRVTKEAQGLVGRLLIVSSRDRYAESEESVSKLMSGP